MYLEAGPHLTQVINCLDLNLTQGKKCFAYSLNLFLYVRTFKIRIYFPLLLAPVLAGSFKLTFFKRREKQKTFVQYLPKIFSSVQLLSHVQLFATPRTAPHQAFLSITNSGSLHKLMSIVSVMPSNHLILCLHPLLLCLQSFPAPGSFPMSWFFTSGCQSIGVSASASVLSMNIQD